MEKYEGEYEYEWENYVEGEVIIFNQMPFRQYIYTVCCLDPLPLEDTCQCAMTLYYVLLLLMC